MAEQLPVTIAVRRSDGTTEHVRVGTAIREGDSFRLQLADLVIGEGGASASTGGWQSGSASGGYGGASRSAPRAPSGGAPSSFPNYGRSKGAPIAGASMEDLEYYAAGCRRTLNDPNKARWHDKERELLAVIEAEIVRQGGQAGDPRSRPRPRPNFDEPPPMSSPSLDGPPGDEPPPFTDDDIPF